MPLGFRFGQTHDDVRGFGGRALQGGQRNIALSAKEHLDDIDRNAIRFNLPEVHQQFALLIG